MLPDVLYTNNLNLIVNQCQTAANQINKIHNGSREYGQMFKGSNGDPDNGLDVLFAGGLEIIDRYNAPNKFNEKMKTLNELLGIFDVISAKMREVNAEDRFTFTASLDSNELVCYIKMSEIFAKADSFLNPKPENFDSFADNAMMSYLRLQVQKVQNEAQSELNRLNPEEQNNGRCGCIVQ